MLFSRTHTGPIGRWIWTVDRLMLAALLVLMFVGFVMVTAGSPPVAKRLNLPQFYFVSRHQVFSVIGLAVMIAVSMLPPKTIRRIAVLGLLGSVFLMLIVPFVGVENKGAHRWITVAGISLQPSEFMKPCFAVVMAWIFSESFKRVHFPGYKIAIGLYALVVILLGLQPDFGMILTVTAMWAIQFFLAGLSFFWVGVMAVFGVAGVSSAYFIFPHVARRIDRFLDPSSGDNYQMQKSMEAFHNGGIMGRGPGEGEVKQFIPDSHTDFIFAVAGEEFGMIACVFIVALFAFIVLRGIWRVWNESDMFVVIAVAGLLAQFGIQAMINMGVAVNLLPAKGMTLPFVSYGGSSLVAIALGMGMVLALTRKRFGQR